MAGVPFVFGNATTSIPLSNLDANFNTGLTIGNTTVGLGNTVTTLGNVTLNNVTINSGLLSTATIPTANGTVMLSGNMPAFSAYMSAAQTISNATATKITFNTKTFDTATAYDATTNYRFTPLVAGYYQVNAALGTPLSATGTTSVYIYKNGSRYATGATNNSAGGNIATVASIVYLNGSTDYIECYGYQSTGISASVGGNDSSLTYFQAAMIRAA